jgi:hypothetical protein
MIALARHAIAIVRALPQLPDFCRHLAELELRVGQAEIDIDVRSCDCGERDCKGWRMVGLDEAARIDAADESQAT